ncbi:Por secretion system C-terminal sorting domain-containing protein [Dyadobacter soli]|uniref:Por secretion system C-terminal sorting domain-containing protein n=1 Tax=Dyadobacter soli TaxID=659014 RepID=A0A1G7RT10_9BACT|nr:right-handed parallel beta-helix repeat-containing protein [Dyadobacter soli]SDG13369.1 Por secretion system C-terminal sorting domain-containing protein [Dyadobacter soli]
MKRLAICIALQSVLLALCQVSYAQKIIYVNDNSTANDKFTTATGNDSNSGTSAGSPFASLTKAMAEASSGDRILLDAGTYIVSSLTVKSGVKIIGTAGDNSVVTASGGPLSLQGNTELWNLKIQRVIPPNAAAPSISVALQAGANNVLIENCYFHRNRTAIYLEPGSTDITIKRNRFQDNRTGIIFPGSAGVTPLSKIYIVDNELTNNRSYGFILTENPNSPIEAYLISNNITGNLAGGIENDNTAAGTKLILRNNWLGSANPTIFAGNTNGGFNVSDHDNPAPPILEANNTLTEVSYPNQISGTNTGAIDNTTVIYADQVQPRPGTVNFVSSNSTNISGHGTFNYFPSIADAIAGSNTDAVITLPNGVYSDNVFITKKVTLSGSSRNDVVIRGTYDIGLVGNGDAVIKVLAADAKIEKLSVTRDYGTSLAVWQKGNRDAGIHINAANVVIDQVNVRDQRSGIYAHTQQGFKITNSLIEKNRTGISLGVDISNSTITNNIIRDNFTHGIIFNHGFGTGITANNVKVRHNAFSGNWHTDIYAHGTGSTSVYATADLTCNTFNTNAATTNSDPLGAQEPGYLAQTPGQFGGSSPGFFASFAGNRIADVTTAPWLINIPAPGPADLSFVPTNSTLNVDAVTGSFTAANNNYRILANAIGCVQENQTISLNGNFDWTETNAAAEWAKGTNAKAGDGIGTVTGNGDNYSITPPAAVNGVTITSNSGATVDGGGDLAVTSLETFLFLNSKTGSSFKNWTISNLILKGFDVSIIADHVNGPADVADNMKITGNEFHIPADLNASAAAADNFQNIGIHYVYGKSIEISNNKFFIDGTGVSDDANSKYSVTYAIQSATSGGTAYDGLKIINNEFTVTGTPNANPAAIKGIWENGHNMDADIQITGNKFTNQEPGNTADKNRQTAFWVTSRSGSNKNVVYQNNEVTGYSEGIAWLGGLYTGNTPPNYEAGAMPVQVLNNIFNATGKGVVVRKAGNDNPGSPAKINSNSFVGSLIFDIVNEGSGTTDASCNWFDGGALLSSTGGGSITAAPKLTNGTDNQPGTTGFQTSAPCEFSVKNLRTNETFATIQAAVDDTDTQDGDEIAIAKGTYNERVTLSKALILSGESKAGVLLDGTGLPGTGSGIVINSGKTNVTIQNLSIKNYTGLNGNSSAGIYAVGGNNNLTVLHVVSSNNTSASGFYANGPVEDVTIDDLTVENNGGPGGGARGIVIWNGFKKDITIINSTVRGNNCCGIELQDGSASGVLIKDNIIEGNDSSIGLVGLTSGAGPNIIEANTITVNGRFGIEIKNPNGTGSTDDQLDGSIIVRNNTVTMGTLPPAEMRDLAGIAVYRRGVIEANGNVDVPTGVVVTNNTVTGFTQPSTSEGFGIVVEGTNHKVINNPVSGNEVDVQRQSGHLPYIAYSTTDGDQANLNDQFFGRGNAPYSCGIEVSGNGGNPVRNVQYNAVAGFVININTGGTFCSINAAVASAKTLDSHMIKVGEGKFDEQVIVNKSVSIQSATATRPEINFTGTPAGKLTIFDISANDVLIDNLNFKVDMAKLKSAIVASGPAIDKITVINNLIEAYGTAMSGAYGDRNAVSVNYGGVTNYRTAVGGVNEIIFTNNIVTGVGANGFRAGIAADEAAGTFKFNDLLTINHDVIVRFASNGAVDISENQFKGGGVEVPEMNASATGLTISKNTFAGVAANASGTAVLRLKNNYNNKPIVVTENTLNGYEWGVSLENVQNVTMDNNAFNPLSGSTTFRHVTVNTKELSSSSGYYAPSVSATLTKNTFNGSGSAGGTGIAFYNHDNDSPVFGTFNIGTAGSENEFAGSLANFIFMDNQTGPSVGPGSTPSTTMAPWSGNVDASNNKFDVGSGPELASGMSLASLYDVEDKIVHKIDNSVLGFATVKSGNTYVTPLSFTPATLTPKIQRGVEAAQAGWNVNVQEGTYAEALVINKAVKLLGANAGVNPNTGSRDDETIIVPAVTDHENGIIVSVDGALTGLEIDGFTIDGDNTAFSGGVAMGSADVNAAEGIAATGGVTNLLIKNNIIRNLNYAGVDIYNDTNGGAATSGNTVSDNKFSNLLPSTFGIGVLLYNNGYANVTNNVMTAVRIGVQTGNFYQADPGNSHAIESNTIEASRKGIWHNLTYASASNFSIKNNTITALAGTILNDGIMVSSTQGTVAPVVENNNITGIAGVSNGYHLWNNPSNTVTIKGGTVSTVATGVFANNFDGYPDNAGSNADASAYTVDGVTINGAANGVVVKDNTSNSNNATVKVTLVNNVAIDQPSVYGVQVLGKDAVAEVGSTEIKMTGSTMTAISVATTNGSAITNLTLKDGIVFNRNGNTAGSILFTDDDATVDLNGNVAIPSGGPTYPAIIEGKLVFTSGILDATAAPIAFAVNASDITTGPKAESSASHILGKAIMLSRPVGTGAINFLGVDLPAGSDLGSLVIERTTSNDPITPSFGAGSIKVLWVITPGNAGAGRDDVKLSFLKNFLNLQNPGTLYGYRYNGTIWEKKTDAFTASLSGDRYTTTAFDVAQFSPWTLSTASNPLPVTLISFNGVKEENSAVLTWATSEETNSDRFDIQHSADGKNWAIVGTMASNGESTVTRNYSFRHVEPTEGANFYRLKMIDKDETFAYSRIVNLNFGSEVVTTLYPNPVSDHMKINTTNWNQVKQVRIFDMLGRTIYDSGDKPTALVSLRNVAAGMYVVEISRLNGKVENSKIMVNR